MKPEDCSETALEPRPSWKRQSKHPAGSSGVSEICGAVLAPSSAFRSAESRYQRSHQLVRPRRAFEQRGSSGSRSEFASLPRIIATSPQYLELKNDNVPPGEQRVRASRPSQAFAPRQSPPYAGRRASSVAFGTPQRCLFSETRESASPPVPARPPARNAMRICSAQAAAPERRDDRTSAEGGGECVTPGRRAAQRSIP